MSAPAALRRARLDRRGAGPPPPARGGHRCPRRGRERRRPGGGGRAGLPCRRGVLSLPHPPGGLGRAPVSGAACVVGALWRRAALPGPEPCTRVAPPTAVTLGPPACGVVVKSCSCCNRVAVARTCTPIIRRHGPSGACRAARRAAAVAVHSQALEPSPVSPQPHSLICRATGLASPPNEANPARPVRAPPPHSHCPAARLGRRRRAAERSLPSLPPERHTCACHLCRCLVCVPPPAPRRGPAKHQSQ
jgi:hypothetical protein